MTDVNISQRLCGSHTVVHHFVCRHRVEVEVWPATAELLFRDERHAHPVNTQVQFDATVYNAPTNRVVWQVNGLDGGPGAGTVDASGLYIAPEKGSLPYGFTELVTAVSVDDPFRRAHAQVVVVGLGPEPPPPPRVEVYPNRARLYHATGHHNDHIDDSNKMQLFRARLYHADPTLLSWEKNAVPVASGPEYLYKVAAADPSDFHITVKLTTVAGVEARAKVSLLDYTWPGIVPH
jgi:hypothetical protein